MEECRLSQRSDLAPNLAIVCSAILWGTFWIPLRALRPTDLASGSPTTVGFLLPLFVLLPFAISRWRSIVGGGWALSMVGVCLGVSVAFYAEGLVRGHVARVLLLFYLMPVWSTLLGRFLLGEVITGRRILAIILGFSGIAAVFGIAAGRNSPIAAGEWMGLVAGIVWGLAMVYLNRTASRPLFDRVFVQFLFLGPVFFLVGLIPGGTVIAAGDAAALSSLWAWLFAFALVWMLPVIWLTSFGASRLDAGRVAILLTLEIIVGLTTAAFLTDEPFGQRECIGAALILGAIWVEVVDARRS
jgi:drug/metabolite transporter (DMT)-like permease